MSGILGLARAARLVGVPRGVLQRMIAAGELASFDGMVAVADLQRLFPDVSTEVGGALEKVAQIREKAFARRVREFVLPSQEVLSARLFSSSVELAQMRRLLQSYHGALEGLRSLAESWPADEARRPELLAALDAALRLAFASEAQPLDARMNMLEAVTASVTVRPSGREFLVEGSDSLLQAGIKAGVRLSYGCGGGTCGLCKARVVSGEVREIAHSDYRLSEQERSLGHVLLCTHTAVSDVVIETLEAHGPQDVPQQEIVATVRAVTPMGKDTLLLHLQTPRSHRLRFLAGQEVSLGWAAPGGDRSQVLALASCPCDERNLHFHVAREMADEGGIAEALFAGALGKGASIEVRGPYGDFVLDDESRCAPVFVACDAGFGPVKSLIEHALASERYESIRLIWVATRPDGHYLENQCRAWAASLDNFAYESLAAPDATEAGEMALERIGALDLAALGCGVFAAGPADFVESFAPGIHMPGAGRMLRTLIV